MMRKAQGDVHGSQLGSGFQRKNEIAFIFRRTSSNVATLPPAKLFSVTLKGLEGSSGPFPSVIHLF